MNQMQSSLNECQTRILNTAPAATGRERLAVIVLTRVMSVDWMSIDWIGKPFVNSKTVT